MNDIMGTLKGKVGGIPVWLWAVIGTAALTLILIRNKGQSATKAAANQTNTDLGTASSLADFFTVAGVMPYSGGDVYVTQTVNGASTPANPVSHPAPSGGPYKTHRPGPKRPRPPAVAAPKIVRVKKGDTLTSIARKYGLTANQLYAYNTGTGPKGANRPPSTIATLKHRGKNLIYANEQIDIPKKGTVYAGGY